MVSTAFMVYGDAIHEKRAIERGEEWDGWHRRRLDASAHANGFMSPTR